MVEGHLEMVEMVQKHTTEGTENYVTISGIVNRTRQMLQATNEISSQFVRTSFRNMIVDILIVLVYLA